jgi:hypothetical protein
VLTGRHRLFGDWTAAVFWLLPFVGKLLSIAQHARVDASNSTGSASGVAARETVGGCLWVTPIAHLIKPCDTAPTAAYERYYFRKG